MLQPKKTLPPVRRIRNRYGESYNTMINEGGIYTQPDRWENRPRYSPWRSEILPQEDVFGSANPPLSPANQRVFVPHTKLNPPFNLNPPASESPLNIANKRLMDSLPQMWQTPNSERYWHNNYNLAKIAQGDPKTGIRAGINVPYGQMYPNMSQAGDIGLYNPLAGLYGMDNSKGQASFRSPGPVAPGQINNALVVSPLAPLGGTFQQPNANAPVNFSVSPSDFPNSSVNNNNDSTNPFSGDIGSAAFLAGTSLDILSQMVPLMEGIEREREVQNRRSSGAERLMAQRDIDLSSLQRRVLGAQASEVSSARNNSRSASVRNSLTQGAYTRAANALNELQVQEEEINNRYRAELAQFQNSVGEARAAERRRVNIANSQNKARYFDQVRSLGQSAFNMGQFLYNNEINKKENELNRKAINAQYRDFLINKQYEMAAKMNNNGQ